MFTAVQYCSDNLSPLKRSFGYLQICNYPKGIVQFRPQQALLLAGEEKVHLEMTCSFCATDNQKASLTD